MAIASGSGADLQAIQAAQAELNRAMDELAAEIRSIPADGSKTLLASQKTVAALKASYEFFSGTSPAGVVINPVDEWKECRSTIDRFDKILVDLRKTGFGFVTAIAAGAQYLFNDSNYFSAKAALLAMLIVLIVTLYWIDLIHQQWLDVAVKRAQTIETRILAGAFTLTNEFENKIVPLGAVTLGLILYLVLLLTTCAAFFYSVPKYEPLTSGHHGVIGTLFGIGLAMILGGWIFADERRRNYRVLQVRTQFGFVVVVAACAVTGIFGHLLHFF